MLDHDLDQGVEEEVSQENEEGERAPGCQGGASNEMSEIRRVVEQVEEREESLAEETISKQIEVRQEHRTEWLQKEERL